MIQEIVTVRNRRKDFPDRADVLIGIHSADCSIFAVYRFRRLLHPVYRSSINFLPTPLPGNVLWFSSAFYLFFPLVNRFCRICGRSAKTKSMASGDSMQPVRRVRKSR